MKLELKHIKAYPNDLKVQCFNEFGGVHFQFYPVIEQISLDDNLILVEGEEFELTDIKLLLTPLTFLSSEFSFHASKIMAIHEKEHRTTSKQVIIHQLLSLVNTSLPITYRISKTHKWIIDYLLENHFDIYGLIDAGLAVDFNLL